MATATLGTVLEHLRKAALRGKGGDLTDAQLLDCYLTRHEEAAFEALVRRHGAMVLGVCRRVLGNAHDAEDAFQATFLVLVRKAATIRPRERVGNWLYGVAYRTALKARVAAVRRQAREAVMSRNEAVPPPEPDDWQAVLDQELERLPQKYRAALVLCDLEGKTRKEAARQLGWADGTLSTRLSRGRAMLVERLSRRGVTLSAAALATVIAESSAAAFVPASLIAATVQIQRLAGLASAAGTIPPKIAALMEGVMKSMAMVKAKKLLAIVLIALGTISLGVGGYQQLPAEEPATAEEAASKPASRAAETKSASVPSGPTLTPALVSVISSGQIVVKRGGRSYVATPVKKQGVMGYEYRRITTVGMQVFDPETVAVFDSRGRKMSAKKLTALLKKESPAFVVQGNEEPDPMVFQLINDKAVIVQIPVVPVLAAPPPAPAVPPAPLAVPPAPAAPIPAFPPSIVPQPTGSAPTPAYLPQATSQVPIPPVALPTDRIILRSDARVTGYARIFDSVRSILGEYFQVADANRFDGRMQTTWRVELPEGNTLPQITVSEERVSTRREVRRGGMVEIDPLETVDTGYYYFSIRVQIHKEIRTAKAAWKKAGRDTVLEQAILRRIAQTATSASSMTPAAPPAVPAILPPAPGTLPSAPTTPIPSGPPPLVPQPVLDPRTERPSAIAQELDHVYFAGKENPGRYHMVFGRALEVAGSFFEIAEAKIFEGRIETEPRPSSPAAFSSALKETPQADREYRRRAFIQVEPAGTGGYMVSVRVLIEARSASAQAKTDDWKQIGRHTQLEQLMLRQLAEHAKRMAAPSLPSPAAPTVVPPQPSAPRTNTLVDRSPTRITGLTILAKKKNFAATADGGEPQAYTFSGNVEVFSGARETPDGRQHDSYLRCNSFKIRVKSGGHLDFWRAQGDVFVRTKEFSAFAACVIFDLEKRCLVLEGTAEKPAQLLQVTGKASPAVIKGRRILYDFGTKQIKTEDAAAVFTPYGNFRPDFTERELPDSAAKAFEAAEFYRRTGQPGAAYFYHELIRRRYADTSYARASTRILQNLQARLSASTKRETPAKVGQIIILGNDKVSDRVIHAKIGLYPGQELRSDDLRGVEKRLVDTGRFNVDPARGIPPTVTVLESDNEYKDLLIVVQEK